MRIAFLGDGSMTHMQRWAGYFAGRGHDVLVLTFEEAGDSVVPCRRLQKILPTKILGYVAALGSVKSELEYFRPDLVNALYAGGYGLVGALSGFRPLVVSTLGSDLLVDYPSSAVHRAQIRYALRHADLVTTDARVLTDIVTSVGIPESRIVEAVFGVDDSIFHPHGDPADRPAGPPRIVSTRNLHDIYDIDTLIDAFHQVLGIAPAELVICGDGPARSRLERKVAALGLESSVFFRGRSAPDAIAAELRGAAVYVSTSRSDSTSVSLLEAMACGTPPIVTDIEANREWIADGENGLLFPAGDQKALAEAIARVLADNALSSRARERNLRLVKERALWTDNMRIVENAFARLAAHRTEIHDDPQDDPGAME
jgi:glycosyltransferase involved in cell wall biosynthesis